MSLFIIRGISKKYGKGASECLALDNVSFELPNNGIVAIEGKSGSGKSTLLNILFGIEKPTSGKVNFNGEDFAFLNTKKMRYYHQHEMAMVFQHYNLFEELSAFDNVILPLLIRGDDYESSKSKTLQIFDKFNLNSIKARKMATFSGGEKQRVAILRALVSEPKVIFLDEPTGALDFKNSIMLMDLLKEISKECLVVLVSHNIELIKRYADRIIHLVDGKIKDIESINKIDSKKDIVNVRQAKTKFNKWTNKFVDIHLTSNKPKNILSLISIMLGVSAVTLSVGFINGSKESSKDIEIKTALFQHATISKTSYFEIENSPLSYEKSERPNDQDIDFLFPKDFDIRIEPSLDYFFTPNPFGKYNDEDLNGFTLAPIYNLRSAPIRNLLIYNNLDDFQNYKDVIVNQEFLSLLKVKETNALNTHFDIEYETSTSYQTGDIDNPIIKDDFSYYLSLNIIGVVKENSFLNMPRVYYSYVDVKEHLAKTIVPNYSKFKGKNISVLDLIIEAKNDNELSSYCLNLFIENQESIHRLFELKNELDANDETLTITSLPYDIKVTYEEFMSAFSKALLIFTIICFIGTSLIVAVIALSNFLEKKKESAILSCLGAKNASIMSIFIKENLFILICACLIALAVSFPIQLLINKIIFNIYNLNSIVRIPFLNWEGIPFLFPLTLILCSVAISLLFIVIPIFIYKNFSITHELRDE